MKKAFLLLFTLILLTGCEKKSIIDTPKDITENQPDWINSEFKFLILDSNEYEPYTRANFYRLNDSVFFLNGYNYYTQDDCFYKLMFIGNNLEIKSAKPLIYGNPRDIKDMSFPNNSTGYLLLNDYEAGYGTKLFRTNDGGESWDEKTINQTFRWIHFITPDSGIAVRESSHEIYSTTDGGYYWNIIVNEYFSTSEYLDDFYFIPQKPRICFISSAGQLLYSSNGGFNWKLHSINNAAISTMSFLNENEGFIATSNIINVGSLCDSPNTIYKIDKIGGSYKKVYSGDLPIAKIEALNENEIYFQKMNSIYLTLNGFQTVRLMTIQDPVPDVQGDRIVVDFTMFSRLGLLTDIKGTISLRNN